MKIPDHFFIRISTNNAGVVGTKFYGRKIKDLFEKVLIRFSYAKSLYSGGRYSENDVFIVDPILQKDFRGNISEVVLSCKRKLLK